MSGPRQEGIPAKERQALFIELAARKNGVTAQEAFDEGRTRGDSVTIEAYHNLGRRLTHRGLVAGEKEGRQTRFKTAAKIDGQWLDEEHLASVIDPEYPLIALAIAKESSRQLLEIPESVWIEARERLKNQPARQLFVWAIKEYSDNLKDELHNYQLESARGAAINELPRLRREIDASLSLLKQLTKHGLGLSEEAIIVPGNVDIGLKRLSELGEAPFYNEELLIEEIHQRVKDEDFIVDIQADTSRPGLLTAAVDGSSRGGLLSFEGEAGDLSVGYAPMVSINTATAQIDRDIRVDGKTIPAFLRLPEKPEDMQRDDNRHTIMAKLFYADLSDSEYMHSVWNAMDVLEAKAALRVMSRWYTSKHSLEIGPADVVLRDGSIVPQDRDSNHYKAQSSYGRIVRDMIEKNFELLQKCRDNDQTLAGVVKNAQIRVLAPVINLFLCKIPPVEKNSQIDAWPLRAMNHLPDQVLLTRLLTSGRKAGDAWVRSCITVRPFHATTDFSSRYSRKQGRTPADMMIKRADDARSGQSGDMSEDEVFFWQTFKGEKDFYVQMLNGVSYANLYIGALPRLDLEKYLPRFEFMVPCETNETGTFPLRSAELHLRNLLGALKNTGFEVSSEHSMFASEAKIDVLPALIIRVHDTVKIWATELLSRVQEYIGYHLSRYIKANGLSSIRLRKWKAFEWEAMTRQLKEERDRHAGMAGTENNKLPAGKGDDQG